MMAKSNQIRLDMSDPYEAKVGAMLDLLTKGHMKLWVIKQCRRMLGDGEPAEMAKKLKDDLTGKDKDKLEDGHIRQQKNEFAIPALERAVPLQTPPTSEPIQKPKEEGEPLRKAAPVAHDSALFL